jgi:hypothetical protein
MRKNTLTRSGGWWWLVLAGLIICLTRPDAFGATASPIRLGWNPAADSAVRGYAIYHGPVSQPSLSRIDARTNLFCTISNLVVGVTYRIYAVSYNAQGVESVPSNELLFTPLAPPNPIPPAGPRLQIARQSNGSMRLSSQATPGTICGIQFADTPNPVVWQTLTNVTANSIGDVIALDISANQVKQRFYRLALSAQPLLGGMTITRQSDGNMLLRGTAPPGATCRVLYATKPNPTSWQIRATVTADAEGRIAYLDTTARNSNSRFYRMVLP